MTQKIGIRDSKDTAIIVDFLNTVSMFDELDIDELAVVVSYMSLYELAKGDVLFREGDTGDYVCFVVDGAIDVLKKSVTGCDVVITTLSRGHSIGEMSLIDQTPRSASIKARNKTRLVVLGRHGFKLISDQHPKIGVRILTGIARILSGNIRKSSEQLNAFKHLLLTVCQQTGQKIPGQVAEQVRLEQEDLLDATGTMPAIVKLGPIGKLKRRLGITGSRRRKKA